MIAITKLSNFANLQQKPIAFEVLFKKRAKLEDFGLTDFKKVKEKKWQSR
jgi:hypothetical protein